MMKDKNPNWSTMSSLAALFIGVILLWTFGKSWLNFHSALVFLAGLIGVAISVLMFGLWQIYQRSNKNHR
jgi:hypothetical protein